MGFLSLGPIPASQKGAFGRQQLITAVPGEPWGWQPGFLTALLHESVSFAFPLPFLFQKDLLKAKVLRFCATSSAGSPHLSFLSCELEVKNGSGHTGSSLLLSVLFFYS